MPRVVLEEARGARMKRQRKKCHRAHRKIVRRPVVVLGGGTLEQYTHRILKKKKKKKGYGTAGKRRATLG